MPKPLGLCTDAYYDVMKRCWNAEAISRPTFESLFDLFQNYFINTEPQYETEEF